MDNLPVSVLSEYSSGINCIEPILLKELSSFKKKIVVLDDDPTGIQTVHGVYVYTDWSKETLKVALADGNRMFFILTNSRSLTEKETISVHREIARNLVAASEATGQDYLLISRSDSTLRGHYPVETEILREETESISQKRFSAEIIYPFFPEGGRYTIENIHYMQVGEFLIPVGKTEFAKDKSFGYSASELTRWCEEKSKGKVKAKNVISVSISELRSADCDKIAEKLLSAQNFEKIVINSISYEDLKVFAVAFFRAIKQGGEFIIRSAAAVTKILGGVTDKPLLTKSELVAGEISNGGIVLIGSHVKKTTEQLAQLKKSTYPISFIEFNQHLVLQENGLKSEVARVINLAEKQILQGKTAVIYTRRDRLDLSTDDKDKQLKISTEISESLTSIIGELETQPSFIIAKGGITSSDVGVKALRVKRAEVLGQVSPGIPVWKTGIESKFPNMPYIIFPGNVGEKDSLRFVVEMLMVND